MYKYNFYILVYTRSTSLLIALLYIAFSTASGGHLFFSKESSTYISKQRKYYFTKLK